MSSVFKSRTAERTEEILQRQQQSNDLFVHKLFGVVLIFQGLACLAAPLLVPGLQSHLLEALVLGAIAIAPPLYMIKFHAENANTRQVVALGQMLSCTLLLYLTNGRIEAHFDAFGSLALLALYRDWRVLVTASTVLVLDHLCLGTVLPSALYGTANVSLRRIMEHLAAIAVADLFLISLCVRISKDLYGSARERAELEMAKESASKTANEQAEKVRSLEHRLQSVLATTSDAIMAIDSEGTVISSNEAAEQLFRVGVGNLAGRSIRDFLRLKAKEGKILTFAEYAEKYFAAPAEILRETAANCSDNMPLTVELSLGKSEFQEQPGLTLIARDVTGKKQGERRVAEFYSTISHELRSPLTSIRGALGLIENGGFGDIPPDAMELITIASGSTKRLIRLINDILDLRRIEEGKMDLSPNSTSAQEIVKLAVESVQPIADASDIVIDVIAPENLHIMGDQNRLVQVLINLLSNAIKFTSPKDRIKVIAAPATTSMIRVTVTDNGPGIAEEDLGKLFGKFRQLDSSDTRHTEGTGLGLAISKALIEQQGGTIGVTSFIGHGSTFWFDVPMAKRQAMEPMTVMAAHKDRTVLIVEDDEDLSKVLQALLKQGGYECLHASTIADAEKILADVLPNAVIMDLRLPDGNGLHLIDKLQSEEKTCALPVVVVTGSDQADGENRKTIIEWLHKPFEDQQLLTAVKKAVTGMKPSTVLIVDDDASTRSIIAKQISSLNVVCIEASDGAEAIAMARKHNPDLIVLDVLMPRPDGFEVVDILRQQGVSNTRLIVYTAKDLSDDDKHALTLGLTKHVSKASRSDSEFLGAVKELLDKNK